MLPHKQIELKLQSAVRAVLPDAEVSAVLVRPCDPKFGDYQSNALMSLAKQRKLNPRQLATDVLAKLDVTDVCEKVEIVGAGFINFRLKVSVLTQTLAAAARGEHLFFTKAASPKNIVIDFSSPNVAKPMHVGHIRSTGIGDALQRTLRLLGHRVVSDNHIGDWGTQFGILIYGYKYHRDTAALQQNPIEEFVRLYRLVTAKIENENQIFFAEAESKALEKGESSFSAPESQTAIDARQELVGLQSGDHKNIAIWEEIIRLSKVQFDTIYGRL
ncbi:MAG: arginine--tRNA ligase, partial [Verrucomicrobiota bacterium]